MDRMAALRLFFRLSAIRTIRMATNNKAYLKVIAIIGYSPPSAVTCSAYTTRHVWTAALSQAVYYNIYNTCNDDSARSYHVLNRLGTGTSTNCLNTMVKSRQLHIQVLAWCGMYGMGWSHIPVRGATGLNHFSTSMVARSVGTNSSLSRNLIGIIRCCGSSYLL